MKFIFTFSLILITLQVSAQFDTLQPFENDYVKFSTLAIAPDINGDGWKDVVSFSPSTNYISWTEKYPCDSVWSMPKPIYHLASDVKHLNFGDFDGDGDQDIIAAATDDHQVLLFENIDGLGNFGMPLIVGDSITNVNYLEVLDINGDDFPDIAATSPISGKFVWFENLNGTVTFSAAQTIGDNFPGAKYIMEADVDGDAEQDMILCTDQSILWTEYSNGFTTPILIDSVNGISGFDIADIDNDQFKDIVIGSTDHQVVLWYRNLEQSGAFSEFNLIVEYDEISHLSVGDIDNDGDEDIAICAFEELENIVWIENLDGGSSFSPPQLLLAKDAAFCSLADMDNDNHLDILLPLYSNKNIVYLKKEETSLDFNSIQVAYRIRAICDVWTGDMNGDGLIDILTASDKVRYHENLGYGKFKSKSSILYSPTFGSVTTHQCLGADMDNDGDMDAVISNSTGWSGWFENVNMNFSFHGLGSADHFDVGDIDGDGDMDYVEVTYAIRWLENINNDFDTEHALSIYCDDSEFIKLDDLDGDSDLDIICVNDEKVIWIENLDGLGNFGPEIQLTEDDEFTNARDAAVVDIDGDSDLDIVVCRSHIYVFKNLDGNANFSNPLTIINANAYAIEIIDVDLDNDPDILGMNNSDIFWSENLDAMGNFGNIQYIEEEMTNIGFPYPVSGDLDNDGDMDLLVGQESGAVFDSRFLILENLSIDTLQDNDQDGYFNNMDCNDQNAMINPCAIEDPDNGIDDDCDGEGDVISIEEIDRQLFSIHPNPTMDIIHIEFYSPTNASYEIYNNAGQLLKHETINNHYYFTIDLMNIPTGIYFIRVFTPQGSITKKLIKL